MPALDIHNFAGQYTNAERMVRESTISKRNKELIFAYRDACLLHQICGRVRLIRAFWTLRDLAARLGKDFDQATKADLQRITAELLDGSYKPTTVATYKSILKRFMAYVLRPNDFPHLEQQPQEIAWLRCHVKKRDEPRLQRCNLLLPADIQALQRATTNARDRALIATLWENGSRISETGNLQIKHVTKHNFGLTLDLVGKTGHRNVLIVSAAPHLAYWLNIHPFADNPEAPLWIRDSYSTTPHHLKYASILDILRRLLERAGIKKRIYPHLFRHSRVTHVIATGIMNEQQAKAYFGWTPDSDMLAIYAHLCDEDANNAILRENNLAPTRQGTQALQPVTCPSCNEHNPPTGTYCTRCTMLLNPSTAYETATRHEHTMTLLLQTLESIAQKGSLDEAATAVHNAGLGKALQDIATTNRTRR